MRTERGAGVVDEDCPDSFVGPLTARDVVVAIGTSGGWDIRLGTGRLRWSAEAAAILGDDRGAPVEYRLRELVAPLVLAASRNGEWCLPDVECEIPLPAGGIRSVRVHAQPYGDPTRPNGILGIAGALVVIADRTADSHPNADLVDRYRQLAEHSPDGLAVHQGGLVVYANPAGHRFLKAGPGDIVGHPITEFVHPESVSGMLDRLAGLTEPGAVSVPSEIRLVALDGSLHEVETTSVLTSWQGAPAYQVILRDLRPEKEADAALRYQAALVEHLSDAIVATGVDGIVTSWNPAAERMYGWTAEHAVGRDAVELLGPLPEPGDEAEWIHRRSDGAPLDVRVAVAEWRDGSDALVGRVIMCTDIAERRRIEQRYQLVVSSLHEGVIVFDVTGVIESGNPAAARLLSVGNGDLVGIPTIGKPLYSYDRRPLGVDESPAAIARRTGEAQVDVLIGFALGEPAERWLSVTARPVLLTADPPYAVVASFSDVTERLATSAALLHQATHDPLTALANRDVVMRAIKDGLATLTADGDYLAVVFIDLDHFKVVNDSIGHGIGDRVLTVIGERLMGAVGARDVVGRLGGDEFIVVARDLGSTAEAEAFAEHLRAAICEPVCIDDRTLFVNASAGVAIAFAPVDCTAEDLVRDADVAMYQAKDRGRGRHEVFDAQLRAAALRRLRLEDDLRAALAGDDLWVAFQPVIDVAAGLAAGTEALLRWDHPEFGVISPVEFISIAEESGLIVPLGARVLELACEQTARWRAAHPELANLHVAVNLSARQLADPNLESTVRAVLARTGLPRDALWLEITESMLVSDRDSSRVLFALRAAGVHLSIDDFGTGYSNLGYLRRFPVEVLKIDRSFVMAMDESDDAAAIVASVTALAHTLGLKVIAEGVENAAQLAALRRLGCDQLQGYYLGRPARADDIVGTLLRRDLLG
ncbi:MAG: hypothetical protein QOJ62_901 [Actinomycetota bacterium]|nr:hypothetical protein [Actinomycetota bacterium]